MSGLRRCWLILTLVGIGFFMWMAWGWMNVSTGRVADRINHETRQQIMELTQLMDEVRSTRDQGKLWTRTRELLDEARKELEVREENWTEAGRKEGTPEHELVRALQWRVATIKEFLSL